MTTLDAPLSPPDSTAALDTRIPVTVLVGFLGAGKTTLLNTLLAAEHGRTLAVVVNDFSQVNVDAHLVRHASDHLVEMSNGCICCTLREDLVREVATLSAIPGLDGIVIESTGIGEPLPIAQAFHMDDLPGRVRLDEIVTVVDAANFWDDFARTDLIEDADGNPVQAPLAPLLVDQLEYTNVVLLNKTDLAQPEALDRLEGFVRGLNPDAKVYRTVRGEIDLALVHGTALYDYDLGPGTEEWDESWELDAASEADEYGFNTFTYLTEAPLRHDAFMALFDDWPDEILRAKGSAAFVDHPPLLLSVVRDTMEIQTLLLPEDPDAPAIWEPDDGDPGGIVTDGEEIATEIVFIGRGLPVDAIVARLDACIAEDQRDSVRVGGDGSDR